MPRALSLRYGCTRLMSWPMLPSEVNTAANLAPMPRSSTFGACFARYGEEDRMRSMDISVPRFMLCSGGTNRISAVPHRNGSSVGMIRSGTVEFRSSYSSGNPCAPSSASDPASIHSPTFFNPASPMRSFSSNVGKLVVSDARRPSGPSPETPSSRHDRSSTVSNAPCAGASGYASGHTGEDAPDVVAPPIPPPPSSSFGCPTTASSGAPDRMYRYDARFASSGTFSTSVEYPSNNTRSSSGGARHDALTWRHVET
mmetsp:Transcript_5187/g.18620  ORF Transcript_5187/g.18620 Transcript_5187/m.18620 type:complete len:256 (+) Transcript_5187:1369-2136(+)